MRGRARPGKVAGIVWFTVQEFENIYNFEGCYALSKLVMQKPKNCDHPKY